MKNPVQSSAAAFAPRSSTSVARILSTFTALPRLLLALAVLAAAPLPAANITLTKAMLDDYHLANGIVDFSQATIGYPPNSVANTLGPGDTVFIQAHTRSFLRLKNLTQGTAANPITVTNTGGQFIIQAVSPTDYDSQGLGLWGCQHVILKGTPGTGYDYGIKIASTKNGASAIKISDNGNSSNLIGSLDIEITNVEVASAGFAGIQAKCESAMPGTYVMDGLHIHHNYIHDVTGEGMYIGWTSSGHHNLANVEINHNILENVGWDGIQVNYVTTNGSIHHNVLIGYGGNSDESGSVGDPNYWQNKGITSGGSELKIYNNWVQATGNLAGNPLFLFVKKNTSIYNNLFIFTGVSGDPYPEGGLFIGESASNLPASGTVVNIMNNTIITPEGAGVDARNNVSTVNFTNNIIAAPGNGMPYVSLYAGTEVVNETTNYYVSTVAAGGFVDPSTSDYSLTSGSAAVNAGTNVSSSGVVDDLDGTNRPQGSAYDIGAYERVPSGDTVNPTVTITSPTSAATYTTSGSTVNLGGSASDNVGVTQVTWVNDRGGSGTASGTTTWSISNLALQTGANVITVTARDAANNTSNDVITVTRSGGDTTAPTVTITSPTSSATYSTSTALLSLGGTASDNVSVTQVTWINDRGGSGTATGTASWSVSSITLQPGTNVLTVTASDAASNTSTDTLTVTYSSTDTTAPVVTITSPTSSTTYSTSAGSLTLGGTASDNVGVTQVSWVNDRGGSGTASGTTSWSATGIVLQSGANVLTVTARDAANNTSTDALTVTYTPPSGGTDIFVQPFSSSTTVSSYVNATSPGANQFNDISAEANGGTWSISGGRLQLVRSGGTGSTNGAGLTRFTDISGGGAIFATVKFKLSMANFNSYTDLAKLTIGNLTALQDYNSTTLESLSTAELVIKGDGNNVFRFLMNQNTSSAITFPANGTDVSVIWYLNGSGSTKTYTGPDGLSHTLNNLAAALYVNNTLLLDNIAKPSGFAGTGVTDFRLRLDTSLALTLTLDDLTITQLP